MCMIPPTQWLSDPPWDFSNWFQSFSNKRCVQEEWLFKICIHWKWWLLEFYCIFCLFTLYIWIILFMVWYVSKIQKPNLIWLMYMLWRFRFGPSWKVKSKTVSNSCFSISKNIYIPCCHEYVICFNSKEWFVTLVDPWEISMIKGAYACLTVMNINLSKSYHKFPEGFVTWIGCIA